jgi:anti-sigma regulatory factor (Ser/Thr protein kinase)
MSVATQQTHGDVTIAITRDPALVRTVRLVAAAVARRAACKDSLIEEIRLAVGEACAVMIGAEEQPADGDGQIEVQLQAAGQFKVVVTGRVDGVDSEFADMGVEPWALLHGLSDDVVVEERDGITTLTMSWPL